MLLRPLRTRPSDAVSLRAPRVGNIVHFTGHGGIPNIGEQNKILHFCLADGSQFTLDDFLLPQRSPPLVTMNSCQVGFAFHKDGDYFGLLGILLLKGIRTHVAPLSWIKPTVSCPFFIRFYDALFSGKRTWEAFAEGLRARQTAKQGARNIGFWAPLALYGDQWLQVTHA